MTLLPHGVSRAPRRRFWIWLAPWVALLVLGGWAAGLVLARGLNQTNMDNRFAFGLWIFLDLTVIALGAGAFTTGFMLYVLRRRELADVVRAAVVIGFVCYSGAVTVLLVDVGQPLRAWFTFWHPNVHSMLTEVTFCISCYLLVLAIEYAPIVLRNRRLRDVPGAVAFEHEMHRLMIVLAGVGALLSFFHQGSLGGLYGVLRGRPFAFRDALAIWPSTFFLFVLSAVAVGPIFLALVVQTTSWITRKPLVGGEVHDFLARLSGRILVVYVGLKSLDTLVWLNYTSPAHGFHPFYFYSQPPFGSWILFLELVPLGLVPALMLVSRRVRSRAAGRVTAALLACGGITLNRYVLTIQTQSLPTLSFDPLLLYAPSWQETATFLGVVAYGIIVYSLSYRYLPLFPRERALRESRGG